MSLSLEQNLPEAPALKTRPEIGRHSHAINRCTREVGQRVRNAARTYREERQKRGLPEHLNRNLETVGGVASGTLNVARPIMNPEQTIEHPLQTLKVGPVRAITGLLKLGASAFGRVLLGKDHHKKPLGPIGKKIMEIKNWFYGLHDWAMKDYDFNKGMGSIKSTPAEAATNEAAPANKTEKAQLNNKEDVPLNKTGQAQPLQTQDTHEPKREDSGATATKTAEIQREKKGPSPLRHPLPPRIDAPRKRKKPLRKKRPDTPSQTHVPLSRLIKKIAPESPAKIQSRTKTLVAKCAAKCKKKKPCSSPKPGCKF